MFLAGLGQRGAGRSVRLQGCEIGKVSRDMAPSASSLSAMLRAIAAHVVALIALILSVLLAGDLETLLKSPLNAAVVIVAVLSAVGLAVWDVVAAKRDQPIRYRGKRRNAKILKYMTRLLKFDGQCVMSSNDLSWVSGEACDALFEKARQKSLVLVMPSSTELSRRLEVAGAEAHYYGDGDFRFRSRFTLVNPSRADSWVAIGHGDSTAHTIREVHAESDPTVYLADDLYRLAKRRASTAVPS